jgi:hypothetical protein
MAQRKKIEIYSAGGHTYREAAKMVKRIAGEEHDVEVLDMHQPHVVAQAARHGIRSVASVVVDGHLAGCCAGRGVDEAILRVANT